MSADLERGLLARLRRGAKRYWIGLKLRRLERTIDFDGAFDQRLSVAIDKLVVEIEVA